MADLNFIFLLNLSTSLFLAGLIWIIQLVHYPSFHFVNEAVFKDFHQFHNRRISLIVIPVMIAELLASGILWWNDSAFSLNGIGFYLVCLIWLSTFLLSVPNHARLSKGKDETVIKSLVNTNWVRTVLWSIKSIISLSIIF